jgi:transglutaminase-like putative cysteine protease
MKITTATRVTMSAIRRVIARAVTDERVIIKAREIVGSEVDGRDPVEVMDAIVRYVGANIGYTRERRELFQDPLTTLRVGTGDCDDHTILVVALANALRIRAEPVLVARAGKGPHHIIPAIYWHLTHTLYDTTEQRGASPTVEGIADGTLELHSF